MSTTLRSVGVLRRSPLTFSDTSNAWMQKGLNTKPRSAGITQRVGPGSGTQSGRWSHRSPRQDIFPSRQAASQRLGPAARSPRRPPPLPPSGNRPEGSATPPDPLRPLPPGRASPPFPSPLSGAAHRPGDPPPSLAPPAAPMVPAPAQFENGAERWSRPTRRKRRGCPGNRSGPQWRRAPARPAGDGGSRASMPGNVTARPRRRHGAPWREPQASATPGDLSIGCCARPNLRPSLGPGREGSFTGEFVPTVQYSP